MTSANGIENGVIDEPRLRDQSPETSAESFAEPTAIVSLETHNGDDRVSAQGERRERRVERTVEQTKLKGTWPRGLSDELQEGEQLRRAEFVESLLAHAVGLSGYVVLAFVMAQPLDRWLAEDWLLGGNAWSRLIVMSLVVYVVHQASSAMVPSVMAWFGSTRETTGSCLWSAFRQSDACARVGIALGLMFVAAMWTLASLAVYSTIWLVGSGWWLVAAAAFFLADSVRQRSWRHLFAAYSYDLQPLEGKLRERFERRARQAGVPVQEFYRINDGSDCGWTGAAVGGRGRHACVLFGDALLDQFTPNELEVVLMHELGHVKFRDESIRMALNLGLTIASFWLIDYGLRAYLGPEATYAQFPVWTLPLMLLSFWLLELVRGPIANFVGRLQEIRCDRYALQQTAMPKAYDSAYRKLAELNWESPRPKWWQTLTSEHPPMSDRLALTGKS